MSIGYTKSSTRIKSSEGSFLKTRESVDYDKLLEFYELDSAVIHEVILNSENKSLIGAVRCRPLNSNKYPDSKDLVLAYPMIRNIQSYPVENEIVMLGEFGSPSKVFYIPVAYYNSINYNGNAKLTTVDSLNEDEFSEQVVTDFIPNSGVSTLTPLPGDTIIQSRFGSGIRLSKKFIKDDINYRPNIIITNNYKNAEIDPSTNLAKITENVDKDGSTILLTSDKLEGNLFPSIINSAISRGNNLRAFDRNFTYRESYKEDPPEPTVEPEPITSGSLNLPTEFIGNQMLLSSDRVVITSKNDEILLLSNSQIVIFSDSRVAIDSKLGFEVSTPHSQTRIKADRVYLNSPNIFLGAEEDRKQPALLGENMIILLESILFDLLDLTRKAGGLLQSAQDGGQLRVPGLPETFESFADNLENRVLDGVSKLSPTIRTSLLSNKVFIASNEIKYTLKGEV